MVLGSEKVVKSRDFWPFLGSFLGVIFGPFFDTFLFTTTLIHFYYYFIFILYFIYIFIEKQALYNYMSMSKSTKIREGGSRGGSKIILKNEKKPCRNRVATFFGPPF